MKKILLSTLFTLSLSSAFSTMYTVSTTTSFTFSPAVTNASVGDTIKFVVGSIHNCTEVSNATWTANGTTPLPGGFVINSPGGQVVLTSPGTRYFVCTVHVGATGMKGQINVTSTGVAENEEGFTALIYPNPANEVLNLNLNNVAGSPLSVEIINLLGKKVIDLGKQMWDEGVVRIDVSTLPRGVYFLNIIGDNRNTKSIRFVKK